MNRTRSTSRSRTSEKGSAFFYILLGIVLFGTLAFTVSRGMRGQQTSTLTKQQLSIIVSEIIETSKTIERGVNRLRRKNISEADICFTHPQITASINAEYANIATCGDDSYKLYHKDGGNVVFRDVPTDWLDPSQDAFTGYGEWVFTNQNAVIGIGAGALNNVQTLDLIAYIPYLKAEVCAALNEKIGLAAGPHTNGANFSPTPLDSGFTTADGEISNAVFTGSYSGCFGHVGAPRQFIFYHVLIERST